jgi:hypothetical protein
MMRAVLEIQSREIRLMEAQAVVVHMGQAVSLGRRKPALFGASSFRQHILHQSTINPTAVRCQETQKKSPVSKRYSKV